MIDSPDYSIKEYTYQSFNKPISTLCVIHETSQEETKKLKISLPVDKHADESHGIEIEEETTTFYNHRVSITTPNENRYLIEGFSTKFKPLVGVLVLENNSYYKPINNSSFKKMLETTQSDHFDNLFIDEVQMLTALEESVNVVSHLTYRRVNQDFSKPLCYFEKVDTSESIIASNQSSSLSALEKPCLKPHIIDY